MRVTSLAVPAMLLLVPLASVLASPPAPQAEIHYFRPPSLDETSLFGSKAGNAGPSPGSHGPDLVYSGGPVLKATSVYIVYWHWANLGDPDHVAPYIEAFFNGVGGSNWAKVANQYCTPTQGCITSPTSQLKGVWYDGATPPPPVGSIPGTTASAYIATEAARAAQHFHGGDDAFYVILLPRLDDADFAGGYCAYHTSTSDGAGHTIAYTEIPYLLDEVPRALGCGANAVNPGAAGALDAYSIVVGHEYLEAVTDKSPNSGWSASDGENADKCAWIGSGWGKMQNIALSTGSFAVQSTYSNAIHDCDIG